MASIKYILPLLAFSNSCMYTMEKSLEENIFDRRTWDGTQKSFSHYRNATDEIVRPINGAGVLPVLWEPDLNGSKMYFLLAAAVVENGTDESIGNDPVYINPSNYPLAPSDSGSYESSIDMAARPEELGIMGAGYTFKNIKDAIQHTGHCFPMLACVTDAMQYPLISRYLSLISLCLSNLMMLKLFLKPLNNR